MGKEITEAARRILDAPNICHLATIMPDGTPQVTPVWVDVENSTILINTAEGRLKEKNLRRDPRVGLSVTDGKNPYLAISIRGRVSEITKDGADEHINRLTKKYLGQDEYPFRQPGEERLMVRIEPTNVFQYPG